MQIRKESAIVEAVDLEYIIGRRVVFRSINFRINRGEAFLITGPSGSGKTTLARILSGDLQPTGGDVTFSENLDSVLVSQQDHFVSASGLRMSYYGQRYESPNEEGIPTVSEYLHRVLPGILRQNFDRIVEELEISHLLERKLLSLSNGERKRVQLAEALLQNPELLVLDQPYIGLDMKSREILSRILEKQKQCGITLVIVTDENHVPVFADKVLELTTNRESKPAADEDIHWLEFKGLVTVNKSDQASIRVPAEIDTASGLVVGMNNVNVSYGGKRILHAINWEVRSGEKWLLRGPNGAGKTTLLSLVSADNPQGYSNDLVIFGRKRGSGESIWDIKRRIGFVSPEMHLYFLRKKSVYKPAQGEQLSYGGLNCIDVVLSGLKDEVGFTSLRTAVEKELARNWIRILGLGMLEKSPFLNASLGEQRALLLARALIKSPDLLILDEPCQGLDRAQTSRFLSLLDHICVHQQITLIYVTHRAEEIPGCITHELQLAKGKVIRNRKYLKS